MLGGYLSLNNSKSKTYEDYLVGIVDDQYVFRYVEFEYESMHNYLGSEFGYFLSQAICLGLGFEYETLTGGMREVYIIYPFTRYYKAFHKKAGIWGQLDAGYGFGKLEKLIIRIKPGFTYFVTKKISVEASLGTIGYDRTTQKNNSDSSAPERVTETLQFHLNLSSLVIGIKFYL